MNKSTFFRVFIIGFSLFVGFIFLAAISSRFIYLFNKVDPDQIGVQTSSGQIKAFVPSGVYSDLGLYVRLERYSTQSYPFVASDPEVVTKDLQRIGVTVSANVFRPTLGAGEEKLKELWQQYKLLYTNDDALQKTMENLSLQAVKVCVGDRLFSESIIGSNRDALRNCVDEELSNLAAPYGFSVTNVTIPNVALSPEVQTILDQITTSRLNTDKAEQDRKRAIAEGTARQAEQEAQIRVEQSRMQEEAKQKTELARLQTEQLKAERQRIEAEKANELLSAQRDKDINAALAAAALERAKADNAGLAYQIQLYTANPSYLQLVMAQTNASAIRQSDKLIFTPQGAFPQLVFGQGLPMVYNVAPGPQAPTSAITGTYTSP